MQNVVFESRQDLCQYCLSTVSTASKKVTIITPTHNLLLWRFLYISAVLRITNLHWEIYSLFPPPPKNRRDIVFIQSVLKGEPRWWVSWMRSIWRASGGTKNTVRGQQKTYTTRVFSGFRGKKPYFHWLKPFLVSLQRLAELLKNI